ncbi:zinc finger, n-recognin [Ophiocordyceps camponoti-floridani]|uniref:Zinc finger, n-recognin n=1 Tax=Ophiocordyceps camponoti-floridani TaxID=2030778 RepID=A0A8H4QAM1_9HYPO|nr:zinc finger, n-recognin [Ophiocordyceps camponoti-floridani]
MSDPLPPPPPPPPPAANGLTQVSRSNSFSQQSDDSQTAADFLRDQELLEADAREALPYSIDSCTKILGPLRQNVWACLTCNPPPAQPDDTWTPAGVCYACSVQCHGEHNLVEIFLKRNFTCDCGTSRIPSTSPCTLRTNDETKTKGGVHSEEPGANKYNQNFRNRFCSCSCDYDPFQQKGTMFQCLGLGTPDTGGCGEDWYHPGCLVGLGPKWFEKMEGYSKGKQSKVPADCGALATIVEDGEQQGGEEVAVTDEHGEQVEDEDEDPPMPPGFPGEDDFEGFLCYKCVDSNPWIKQYAGTGAFLPAVFLDRADAACHAAAAAAAAASKKRKAEDSPEEETEAKRPKNEMDTPDKAPSEPANTLPTAGVAADSAETVTAESADAPSRPECKLSTTLPPAPSGRFSLFFRDDFRSHLCHCNDCYRRLNAHPQLLEEEEAYEPPLSADGDSHHDAGSTLGSGSLLERGESALRNVDRVRAIEGVMAYNHLKEQLKPFFQQFADSGKAVGAEDIKAYFAKLRGDDEGIGEAAAAAAAGAKGDEGEGDDAPGRREQSGY